MTDRILPQSASLSSTCSGWKLIRTLSPIWLRLLPKRWGLFACRYLSPLTAAAATLVFRRRRRRSLQQTTTTATTNIRQLTTTTDVMIMRSLSAALETYLTQYTSLGFGAVPMYTWHHIVALNLHCQGYIRQQPADIFNVTGVTKC